VVLQRFDIQLNDAAQTAQLSIDGQVVATLSTNYPQSSPINFAGAMLNNTTAATGGFLWSVFHVDTLN
jgi:hypothetical protein